VTKDNDPKFMDMAFEIEALKAELAGTQRMMNGAYSERNMLVAALAHLFPAGVKSTDIPGWDAEWHNCVFIDTPAGQMSWHYHDVNEYDTIIGIAAIIAALCMMVGTGLGVLGAGIWILRRALRKDKP
jgi:hypothetical protein